MPSSSFAVVLWEIWTRQTPFSGPRYKFDRQLKHDVLNGTRPAIPDDTPANLSSLIQQCWQENPKARLQFGDIVLQLQSMIRDLSLPQNAISSPHCLPGSVTQMREIHDLCPVEGQKEDSIEIVELNDL